MKASPRLTTSQMCPIRDFWRAEAAICAWAATFVAVVGPLMDFMSRHGDIWQMWPGRPRPGGSYIVAAAASGFPVSTNVFSPARMCSQPPSV